VASSVAKTERIRAFLPAVFRTQRSRQRKVGKISSLAHVPFLNSSTVPYRKPSSSKRPLSAPRRESALGIHQQLPSLYPDRFLDSMNELNLILRHAADSDFVVLAVCIALLATLSLTEGKLLR
jgi:hypothetical protein